MCNSGSSYAFDRTRLDIYGTEVDKTRLLGVTSTTKELLSRTPNIFNCYRNSGWDVGNKSIVDADGAISH